MAGLDGLLFKREYFPVTLTVKAGIGSGRGWIFDRIEMPPYHPSMGMEGIPFELVPGLLEGVVEETVRDLESAANDDVADIQARLGQVERDPKTGRILMKPKIAGQRGGLKIGRVPVVGQFYVGRLEINPYDEGGDQGIRIVRGSEVALKPRFFLVPQDVALSTELMREYEISENGLFLGKRRMTCPNLWYSHDVGPYTAIFYRNLVIALDNAVMVRKDGEKEPSVAT